MTEYRSQITSSTLTRPSRRCAVAPSGVHPSLALEKMTERCITVVFSVGATLRNRGTAPSFPAIPMQSRNPRCSECLYYSVSLLLLKSIWAVCCKFCCDRACISRTSETAVAHGLLDRTIRNVLRHQHSTSSYYFDAACFKATSSSFRTVRLSDCNQAIV